MDNQDLATIWFIAGALLMAAELLLPGGIVFFLGLGAAFVSLLLYTGILEGWLQAFTAWFIGSLVLVFGLRGIVQKLVPAVVERGKTDEDLDAYNQHAEVCERIPAGDEGRIIFRGSTWPAKGYAANKALEVGTVVRIVFRDNLVWIVEPIDTGDTVPNQTQEKS